MNEKTFTIFKLSHLTAKNRIIRSATNDHLGNRDGSVSDDRSACMKPSEEATSALS